MKRIAFYSFMILAVTAVSCTREQDYSQESENNELIESVSPVNNSIFPDSFSAGYDKSDSADTQDSEASADTKTSYDADGKYSWVLNDAAALYFVDNPSTPENQGWIEYQATTLTNSNRTATFTKVAGQGEKETAMSSYTGTGIAIYPASAASPSTGNTGATTYGAPYITLKSSVSGNSSDVVLIGTADNAAAPTNIQFKTAMAILKFTVTDIPAQAAALRLFTSDKVNFPLTGNFTWGTEITHTNYQDDGGEEPYLSVDLSSSGAIASGEFYFNIPTGTYPENTLKIQLLDGNENVLMEQGITKEFTFERNDLIKAPSLANQWVPLGTGKFIDNHMWGKMGFGTNTFEEVGNVNVEFYQNAQDGTKYRLANPYGQAASYLAAEGQSQGEHDDYLEFTVPAEGNVSFINHKTGYTYSDQIISIQHISSEKNTVTVGTRAEPKIVQLAPIYKGSGDFQESRNSCANKIQIIFPSAVDAYGGSLSIINNKADLSDGLSCTKGSSVGTLCLYLSNEPIFTFFDEFSSVSIASGPGSRKSNPASPQAVSALGWGNKSGDSYDQTQSGIKYLTWSTWNNNSGDILYQIGCKKFYGLVPSDVTKLIGDYSLNYGSGVESVPMVFEVSDDPKKGNIKLTYFAGVSGELYGVYKSDNSGLNLQFLQSKTTEFASNTYIYSNNSSDLNDLNFSVGFNTSSNANYKNKNWDVISWNAYIKLNKNGNVTSYSYMRGDKMQDKPKITLTDKLSVNLECCEKDGTHFYEGSSASTALIDGNKSTYWHTPYYSLETLVADKDYYGYTYTDPYVWSDLDSTYGAYIDVDLGEGNEIQNFKTRLGFRAGASGNFPKHIRIFASDDKLSWGDPIAEVGDVTLGKSTSAGDWSDYIWCPIGSSKRYIRIAIIKNSGDGSLTDASKQKCVHVSELEIYGE